MSALHAAEAARTPLVVPLVAALSSAGSSLVVPGPTLLIVAGVTVPIFSAIAGAIGVGLGLWLTPQRDPPLGWSKRIALVAALEGLILCSVIALGQQPLVAIGWGIGLGFSGPAVTELLGSQAKAGIKTITDAFIAMAAASIGAGKPKDGQNE